MTEPTERYVTVARLADIPPGQTLKVMPTRRDEIVLCNVGGQIYGVVDACSHDGGMLGFGSLEDKFLACPRHGALFDVTNGAATTPPATLPIRTYSVRVENGEVQVAIRD